MIGDPTITQHSAQPYVGIRTCIPMSQFGTVIPRLMGEVTKWLSEHDATAVGPPFLRYHVIDMPDAMDVELGLPVAGGIAGEGRVQANSLPQGNYASLTYVGVSNGIDANAKLVEWVKQQGLALDHRQVEAGDAFAARYEVFLTDTKSEPDQEKWESRIEMKLAD